MKMVKRVTNLAQKHKKFRAQVFILATLVIAVYTVSIIAVVTELSINRTKIDEVDVPHMVNEYLSEMNYQLEMQLFNYVLNSTVTNSTIIANLESFVSTFSLYASSKGVATSINLRLNEYSLSAKKNGTAPSPIVSPSYNKTMYIEINSSITFQSSSSGSTVSGIFIHYYGINFASNTPSTSIIITEKDFYGNTLQFISGATFIAPATFNDNGDGSYSGDFATLGIDVNLPSGIIFIS